MKYCTAAGESDWISHDWVPVGTQDVMFERDEPDPPPNMLSHDHWPVMRCVIYACPCGFSYLRPIAGDGDIMRKVRPFPVGMKRP